MLNHKLHAALLLATSCLLAACGGGSGTHVASTPTPPVPPPVTPPPPTSAAPPIMPGVTTSQQFAAVGNSHPIDANPLNSAGELQVRYVASSNSYEVQLPNSQDWVAETYSSNMPGGFLVYQGGATMWLRPAYQYSRLFEWAGGDNAGYEAIGIPTPAGGVPVTGSASYTGPILGRTTEYQPSYADDFPVDGSILLSFNFGAGSLSGKISPNLHQGFNLGDLNFVNTVYSTGSSTFSGKFDTNASGVNSFSGLFTGPAAQELIGKFAFPYVSPIDSKTYQADGAFVGAK